MYPISAQHLFDMGFKSIELLSRFVIPMSVYIFNRITWILYSIEMEFCQEYIPLFLLLGS